jgi:hypothetical protein
MKIEGQEYDICLKADGSLFSAPGSIHVATGKSYTMPTEWTIEMLNDLPIYDEKWLNRTMTPAGSHSLDHNTHCNRSDLILLEDREIQAWKRLVKHGGTIAKQSAHKECIARAGEILWNFALPYERAMHYMMIWAELPGQLDEHGMHSPWSEKEIEHKLKDALKKPREPHASVLVDMDEMVDAVVKPHTAADVPDYYRESIKPSITKSKLPPITIAGDFLTKHYVPPQELVEGVLHRGSKLSLGGPSKSFKTWTLIDLALAISTGTSWLGFNCAKGNVLYLNFEIQEEFFQSRLKNLVASRKCKDADPKDINNLHIWNLRGYCTGYQELFPLIKERIKETSYDLIVIDPLYKLYGETDENSAKEVAKMLNAVENLCTCTHAAVSYGAHFAKGDSSKKASIDRVSGSGVFARDPDSIINFQPHQEDGCFTVDAILRNFSPIHPFVVKWDFPRWGRIEADPKDISQSRNVYSSKMILALLGNDSLLLTDWQKRVGCSKNTLVKYKNELCEKGVIEQNAVTEQWSLTKRT